MRHGLIRLMEQNPVVPALKSEQELELCLRAPGAVIFVLCGDILNIDRIIAQLHDGGKKAVVHADLVAGLAAKEIAADFLQRCGADGIISTRPALVRRGRELGMLSVLRLFALDSKAVSNLLRESDAAAPDMIEILPGTLPRILRRVAEKTATPLIAGGLIEEKADILSALGAGALCVSTSDAALWNA